MSEIAKREAEIEKQRRFLEIEALALRSFRKTGRFELAIPGYKRMVWVPRNESDAQGCARHAARIATTAKPLPLRCSVGQPT